MEMAETRSLGDIADQLRQDLPGIKRRLAQGADPNDTAEYKDGVAPLYRAAARGHVEMVDALADAGADLGWKHLHYGNTALHDAARNGHASVVRSLAARGGRAAVDARDNYKQTPLHWAARNGRPATAQVLLEAGADAALKNSIGVTALDLAVSRGKPEVAACIRQADEARRLCGAQQRLALAASMLASVEAATAGLGELPYDLLRGVCETVSALGPPVVRVVFRAADEEKQEQKEKRWHCLVM